jgi:FtsX-like permease family
MRFRAELRARWRTSLTLTLFAGLAGGVVVAAVAGAHRTDSALARHLAAYRLADVTVAGPSQTYAKVAAAPQVESWSIAWQLVYATRGAGRRPVLSVGTHALQVEVSGDAHDGATLDRWKLLAGRRPAPEARDEALVDSRAAATLGVRPGDTIRLRVFPPDVVPNVTADPETMRTRQLVALRVVGVKAATDTVNYPGGVVRLTPAFLAAHPGSVTRYSGTVMAIRLKHGAADLPAFLSSPAARKYVAWHRVQRDEAAKVQRSIHLQAQALRLTAALVALLAVALLWQAQLRGAAIEALAHPTLRALGMTRRQLLALDLLRALAIGAFAAVLAVALAAALSPLAPIGLARELEPRSGFAVDALVLALGGGAVLAAVLAGGALAGWRSGRTQEVRSAPTGSVPAADMMARLGLPSTAVMGVRLALARGRGATAVPVGATLLGAVLAVAVAGSALTFSASLDHLFSTPRLYGENWDYRSELAVIGRVDALESALRANPAIADATLGTDVEAADINGRDVGFRAMDDVKGHLPPVVLEGRAPRTDDEILLATRTLRALQVQIGDTVTVASRVRMRVVGRGVLPQGPNNDLGEGAAVTFSAWGSQIIGGDTATVMQVRIAEGANRSRTLRWLERQFFDPAPGLPRDVANFGGVRQLPLVLSALVVLMAAGALAHTLVTAIRRRRRELAILKTLGFDRGQVVATVAWQATTYAALGLVVGLPLGVAAGRWLWNLFAQQISVVPEPVTPVPFVLLVVPLAVLLANVVAVIPAFLATRVRPALALRAE